MPQVKNFEHILASRKAGLVKTLAEIAEEQTVQEEGKAKAEADIVMLNTEAEKLVTTGTGRRSDAKVARVRKIAAEIKSKTAMVAGYDADIDALRDKHTTYGVRLAHLEPRPARQNLAKLMDASVLSVPEPE